MITACGWIDATAFVFALIVLFSLPLWRWNGEMHSGDDRGPQDGRPPYDGRGDRI